MSHDEQTKFEALLKEFVPEIYELHRMTVPDGEGRCEKHVWEVVKEMVVSNSEGMTGTLLISYNKGHIDRIIRKIDVIAYDRVKGIKT